MPVNIKPYTIAEKCRQNYIQEVINEYYEKMIQKAMLRANQGQTTVTYDCTDACASIPDFQRRFFAFLSLKGFIVQREAGVFTLCWDERAFPISEEIKTLIATVEKHRMNPALLKEIYIRCLADCDENSTQTKRSFEFPNLTKENLHQLMQLFLNDGFQCQIINQNIIVQWKFVTKRFTSA